MLLSFVFDVLRFLGGGVCHQLPDRSLQVAGQALPLCARCSGTYLGAVIGLLAVLLPGRGRASLLPRWPALATLGAFLTAWGIDGLNSYLTFFPEIPHLYPPTNTLRLLTGALEGLALSLLLWPVAGFTLWRRPREEPITSVRELVAPVASTVAVVGLLSLEMPGLLLAAGVLSILGLLSIFALLNALLLIVVTRREGRFDNGLQTLPLLASTFLLGAAELALLSTLRHWLLPF